MKSISSKEKETDNTETTTLGDLVFINHQKSEAFHVQYVVISTLEAQICAMSVVVSSKRVQFLIR